jgi:hypothetical protein
MPAFLEKKLKKEYGNDKHAIYGTMNKIGAMKGNKETPKGRAMEKKHEIAKKMDARFASNPFAKKYKETNEARHR